MNQPSMGLAVRQATEESLVATADEALKLLWEKAEQAIAQAAAPKPQPAKAPLSAVRYNYD